ncbi:hypothetical protein QQ045_027568 [Rhodiola kirilowii]
MDAESRIMIDWMEKGVYDALQKKYLKTLLFCICETVEGPMIEEYAFSFSYPNNDSQEVSMDINRTGDKKGGNFKYNSKTEVTPNEMRSSACKMIRTLVQLMRTLDRMPEEVKSLLDPCGDENDDNEDGDVSVGDDSDEYADTESEVRMLHIWHSLICHHCFTYCQDIFSLKLGHGCKVLSFGPGVPLPEKLVKKPRSSVRVNYIRKNKFGSLYSVPVDRRPSPRRRRTMLDEVKILL